MRSTAIGFLLAAPIAVWAAVAPTATRAQSAAPSPETAPLTQSAAPPSLFARMGGSTTVTEVIDEVIDRAASDPLMKRSFLNVDLARIKRLLVEQICELAGGGCRYSGDSMHDVHAGLGITQAEFYALVQTLRDSMIRHGIGLRERNEILRILAPMKHDVVEK